MDKQTTYIYIYHMIPHYQKCMQTKAVFKKEGEKLASPTSEKKDLPSVSKNRGKPTKMDGL